MLRRTSCLLGHIFADQLCRNMSNPRRILIVDDEVDVANILRDLLKTFDFEVRVCYDGSSALEVASRFDPHVALVDVGMPDFDGFEVVAELRRNPRTRHLRAVSHSAWGDSMTMTKAFAAGVDEHTTKPISLERLLELASEQYWEHRPLSRVLR